MTEYWVSQSKHWCELCKCWLNDTPESRANHERGSGHKLAVQRKLREMRIKAEEEQKVAERTQQQLDRIDKAAEEAYDKDVKRLVRSHHFGTFLAPVESTHTREVNVSVELVCLTLRNECTHVLSSTNGVL
jgi:U1 zinc finger